MLTNFCGCQKESKARSKLLTNDSDLGRQIKGLRKVSTMVAFKKCWLQLYNLINYNVTSQLDVRDGHTYWSGLQEPPEIPLCVSCLCDCPD